jgi:CHAT domain-containing protein/Tfp pilus assembly protein PilF
MYGLFLISRVLLLAFLAGVLLAAPAPEISLHTGRPAVGRIRAGAQGTYNIRMRGHSFVRIRVQQEGGPVAIRLLSGKDRLVEILAPGVMLRQESVVWMSERPGDYRAVIASTGIGNHSVAYRIELVEVRPAVPADRDRLAAQKYAQDALHAADRRQFDDAIADWERALEASGRVHDREGQAVALQGIGVAMDGRAEHDVAVRFYAEAVSVFRAIHDRRERETLNVMGVAYLSLRDFEKASRCFREAGAMAHRLGDRTAEAAELQNIGDVYFDRDEYDQAIAAFQQSRLILRGLDAPILEATTLNGIAISYINEDRDEKAIPWLQQALDVFRKEGDRQREATAITNLGRVYSSLARYDKAKDYYERGITVAREAHDLHAEAWATIDLGWTWDSLGNYDEALANYTRALALYRRIHDRDGEAFALFDLGSTYCELRKYQDAIGYHNQALAILRDVHDPGGEGIALKELAIVYRKLHDYDKAADYAQKALTVDRQIKSRSSEVEALVELMEAARGAGRPRLAIFYGKQAVNTIQSLRSHLRGLDRDLQQSFLKGNERPYHTLAELLIAQGRLAEAEQVLDLLKEEEYFQYVRRDGGAGARLTRRSDLTPDEADWEKRYRAISDRLVAIGVERGALLAKPGRTQEEMQRLDRLEDDLATGNRAFEQFLDNLTEHFSGKPEAAERAEQLRESRSMMEDLRELPTGTVAIYTMAGDDKFRAILVTPDAQKAYEYPIGAAELNRKIFEFRQAVQNPELDPRPLGQELYRILVANMENDLRQAGAKTLMWSLDGTLRYLPLAALFDGHSYLVERYALAVFTAASNARLKDRPDAVWTAAGFGVTRPEGGAPALPAVRSELTGIIATRPGGRGVMEGDVELDDQFTLRAMRRELLKRHPVVHIASHFSFQPGNEEHSFLLLGDGTHLSLAELESLPNLFGGVQVLTLSACNTGIGGAGADGKEVEGFGVLAQREGAKAVIASLWQVADASTSVLMQAFYRIRESSPRMTKGEALREAQVALLEHTPSAEATANRGLIAPEDGQAAASAPRFVPDPRHPYAHPYYWAPFFVMGNWL